MKIWATLTCLCSNYPWWSSYDHSIGCYFSW